MLRPQRSLYFSYSVLITKNLSPSLSWFLLATPLVGSLWWNLEFAELIQQIMKGLSDILLQGPGPSLTIWYHTNPRHQRRPPRRPLHRMGLVAREYNPIQKVCKSGWETLIFSFGDLLGARNHILYICAVSLAIYEQKVCENIWYFSLVGFRYFCKT